MIRLTILDHVQLHRAATAIQLAQSTAASTARQTALDALASAAGQAPSASAVTRWGTVGHLGFGVAANQSRCVTLLALFATLLNQKCAIESRQNAPCRPRQQDVVLLASARAVAVTVA